ncbi:MAG: universal stress protein [Nitrosomonas sp.]|jgi:nucleotide-binding universal stress UspA family protein|nr:universal stress protein [Nitrosomonas sp.]
MKKTRIDRILVALDSSAANQNILRASITLASYFHSQLNALFIEDADLINAAELPFVREIVLGSPSGRAINAAGMERSIQLQTTQLRKLVASVAQQNQIDIAFNVLRGNVARTLCEASGQTDLLVIGKNSLLQGKSRRVGSITRSVMSSVQCDLAVLHYGSNIERPVVTGFTGSTASLRAVSLAIDLAHEDHGQLIIILPATDDLKYEQLNKAIEENFNMQQLRISLVRLPNNSTDQILHVIQQFHGRILLLESSSAFLTDEQKQALIAQADIPVIFLH